MNFITEIFNVILYQPILNALILIYNYLPLHDLGLAIIILTILIRIVFYPLMSKSIKSQKALSAIQPKIEEVQNKFKDDKEKQAKEVMAIYQREKINPLGGCLPILIQLPIFFALFWVLKAFGDGLSSSDIKMVYSFISLPSNINLVFLGILNLAVPSFVLALFVGLTQFLQSKMLLPETKKDNNKNNEKRGDFAKVSSAMQKPMSYFFSFFSVVICLQLPAAVALYWGTTNLFSIIQQKIILS